MKDLMKTNCYDIDETLVIVGSCLESVQQKAYKELTKISKNIFDVCLESTHVNMVITKLIGMLCRVKVKKVVFATVDGSPHCTQLHYIENEIQKAMNLNDVEFMHYVAVDDKLQKITQETILSSKLLHKIEKNNIKNI